MTPMIGIIYFLMAVSAWIFIGFLINCIWIEEEFNDLYRLITTKGKVEYGDGYLRIDNERGVYAKITVSPDDLLFEILIKSFLWPRTLLCHTVRIALKGLAAGLTKIKKYFEVDE
jgi:hypothetical protein